MHRHETWRDHKSAIEHPRAQGCPSASINDPEYALNGLVPVMPTSPTLVDADATAPAADVPLLAQPPAFNPEAATTSDVAPEFDPASETAPSTAP